MAWYLGDLLLKWLTQALWQQGHSVLREHRNVWGTLDRRLYAGQKYPLITTAYKQSAIKERMVAPDIAVLS
jgi:hypothetical protein